VTPPVQRRARQGERVHERDLAVHAQRRGERDGAEIREVRIVDPVTRHRDGRVNDERARHASWMVARSDPRGARAVERRAALAHDRAGSPMTERPINLFEYGDAAEVRLTPSAFDYYRSGAHDEITLRATRE